MALWHERDISHSGAERVVLPDATILLDYTPPWRRGSRGHRRRRRATARNLDITYGALFSQTALLALVERGMSRDEAYRVVQGKAQQAWDKRTSLRELLAAEGRRSTSTRSSILPVHPPRAGAGPARRDPGAGMSEALLMRAGPAASADLYHAIPLDILDPFLYLEAGERKVAVIGVLERDRIEALELGIEVIDPFELGLDSLLNDGVDFLSAEIETDLRACQEIGLEAALVPPDFPLAWADKLRDAGIDLTVDDQAFDLRRRRKTEAQLAGIRRAQAAADAAMGAAAELLRELPDGLTCEQVRERMQAVCKGRGAELPDTAIVAHGAQSASGHEEGSGPIDRGGIVLIDIGRATRPRAAGPT